MNAYYHEFQVGFNCWMVIAPLLVVVAIVVGFAQTYLKKVPKGYKLRFRYNENMFLFVAVLSAVIFGVLLFLESSDGIVQYFDNHLGQYESPVWSLFLAPFAMLFASALFGVVVFFAGIGASIVKILSIRFYFRHLRRPLRKVRRATARFCDKVAAFFYDLVEYTGKPRPQGR